jgi:hypothetical protein
METSLRKKRSRIKPEWLAYTSTSSGNTLPNSRNSVFAPREGDCLPQRYRMNSMPKKAISPGAVHTVPADLRKVLVSDPEARAKWEDITPLARNEWICWAISVKKPETRKQHIERVRTELKEGMRRPCCWPGCPHR